MTAQPPPHAPQAPRPRRPGPPVTLVVCLLVLAVLAALLATVAGLARLGDPARADDLAAPDLLAAAGLFVGGWTLAVGLWAAAWIVQRQHRTDTLLLPRAHSDRRPVFHKDNPIGPDIDIDIPGRQTVVKLRCGRLPLNDEIFPPVFLRIGIGYHGVADKIRRRPDPG